MSNLTRTMMMGAAGAAADPLYVDDVFSTYVYDGQQDPLTITNGIDLSGEGGLVWTKRRKNSIRNHILFDSERGVNKSLYTDSTDLERTQSTYSITMNSDGYSWSYRDNDISVAGSEYVSWTFRKAPGFFDVVTYTGNNSVQNISHSLGSIPGMIIVKNLSTAANWIVYHRSTGPTKKLELNESSAAGTNSGPWNDTAPTASVFTVGTNNSANGDNYVAYIFAHDDASFGTDGDESIIKCGSYSGNNGSQSIDLGFEPQWLLIKVSSGETDDWYIFDSMRGWNQTSDNQNSLRPNQNYAELASHYINPTSTGFSLPSVDFNKGGKSYIYMAIRRPHKPPEVGTEVFAIDTYGGTTPTPPIFNASFPVDFGFFKSSNSTQSWRVGSRLTSGKRLEFDNNGAESSNSSFLFDYQNGWYFGTGSIATTYSYMFKRAPGFMDVVAYKGTGSVRTLDHNLEAVPELVIVKNRENGSYGWATYTQSGGRTKYLEINDTHEYYNANAGTMWGNSDFTSTQISLGSYANTNHNNVGMIAYLFATLPGISKVGSYSGTGNAINVDCGFTNGARFILIKRTDTEIQGTGGTNWYIWDSLRGIVSGNDPYLLLNKNDAQVTNTDYVDPLSSGFTVTSSGATGLNVSGGTYIFLAIA